MTTRTYLPSAPEDLITAHRERQVAKGYKQLELLITHLDMERAWREITKRARPGDKTYGMRLFSEIITILHRLRRTGVPRRSEERSRFLTIAKHAEALARSIENGPFDKQAYEYFPSDVMEINNFSEWAAQDGLSRSALAYDVLRVWPSLPEMLHELASQATIQANAEMTGPRLVDRQLNTASYRQLYFVRGLTAYMMKEFDSPLYGTVARIANAVLATGLTQEDVKKMIKGGR